MPHPVKIPFYSITIQLANNGPVTIPLTDMASLHVDKSPEDLAIKFQERFQKNQIDQGKYTRVLDLLKKGSFTQKKLVVPFPPAKDGISYPAFSIHFDCFLQHTEKGYWGVLPALGLEALAADEKELGLRLQEVVRVEFTTKKRMQAVQQILSASWFEGAAISSREIQLDFYSPAELTELKKEKKRLLLPQVAEKLVVKKKVAYGREEELAYMERILKSRFNRNILLVGASGTGKTALVWELVRIMQRLGMESDFWETNASMMIKELTQETGWQDNLSHLVKELTEKGDILFVRNLAELFEVGRYEGNAVSMAEYLRPFLGRGELSMISECTPEERARIEVRSPNFLAFFQTVQLEEPKTGLEDIIHQKVDDIAREWKIKVDPEAIREIIRLHRRFSPYSGMPGKPIRFLESIILGQLAHPDKNTAVVRNPQSTIYRQTIIRYYCEESGMPPFMVDPEMPMDPQSIKSHFNQNVFGQERAVHAVVDMLSAVKTALTRTGKPIASFLFVGPTGVGKTELAKVLAEFMFGSRERMIRFDMSEYSDPYAVMRLTGEAYFSDGLLTSAVRREPFCVLLFDEIEKAAPNFNDLLLQILGEGRLTDSRGKLVNFCSAIIIMTSNIGAATLQSGRIGWKKDLNTADVSGHFMKAVEQHFRPELFNRIDAIIAFEPLSRETVRYVVERETDLFRKREGIRFRRLELTIEEAVSDYLAVKGFDPKYGARYLQRTIREELIVPLAQALNGFDYDERLLVRVAMKDDRVDITSQADPLGFDLLMEQWDKLTLAETASAERRHFVRLMEGPLFMRLQSEIDLIEQKKKRQGDKFWENIEQASLYTRLLGAKESAAQLYQAIEALEMDIALASMDQVPFQKTFEERLEHWKEAVFSFKISLYATLHPKHNTCHIGIYGADVEHLLKFYLDLFSLKGWAVKQPQSVWFRERPVQGNGSTITPDSATTDMQEVGAGTALSPSNYIKAFWNPPGRKEPFVFLPPHKNDLLCGVELELEGEAVWPWLKPEAGIQEWFLADREEPMLFFVETSLKDIDTPDEVHRLAFFKKEKPRRRVEQEWMVDKLMGINNFVSIAGRPAYTMEKLDARFRIFLDKLFLG
ncbi:MAG: AAA family ATPase [Saprospiraceae bacterium]